MVNSDRRSNGERTSAALAYDLKVIGFTPSGDGTMHFRSSAGYTIDQTDWRRSRIDYGPNIQVQAIFEKFDDMQKDLNRERKTMTKLWGRRQEQICCVIESTAGMYGDMQGIAGKTLPEIEGLDIKMLESKDSPT